MRIAISVEIKDEMNSVVAQHFGRCPYFALIDVEGREVKALKIVDNPYYGHHQPGQVPGFIKQLNADVMLSGGMGGRAIEFFNQMGIETATGADGTVRTALENYLGGELTGAEPCIESVEHHKRDHH